MYNINTAGALVPFTPEPIALIPKFPSLISFDPQGAHAYVANGLYLT